MTVVPTTANPSRGIAAPPGARTEETTERRIDSARLNATAASGQSADKRWWDRGRGTIGLIVLGPFVLAVLFSPPQTGEHSLTHVLLDTLGWLLFLSGGALRLWASLYIGGHKGRQVIDVGPYSVLRHPLYVSTCLMGMSIGLFVQSVTLLVGLTLAGIAYLSAVIPGEERRLESRLGEAYASYCRRVPRFGSLRSSFFTPPRIDVDVRCLHLEFRRALRWVWLPVLCQAISHLRYTSDWPRWFLLP